MNNPAKIVTAIAISFMSIESASSSTPEQQGTYQGVVTLNTINLGTGKTDKSPFDMSIWVTNDDKINMSLGAVNYWNIPAAIGVKHGGMSFTSGPNRHGSVIFNFVGKGKSIKGFYQFADHLTLQTINFKLKKM